ncbi:hypothetical protein BDZ94DRAFT_1257174 [Collybia nuda]|uniref:Uncharacterized protein n=1 Tax=Collybia nuda TaxID=64659 RepID=A0A9P6CKW4_9AGAR|nr:hypothetical protein BDZ94DRAFT_1257174 [Collybia nuda]
MERLSSKPPLITPSASPPTSHTFFPQPYRIPDQASPVKRPRLSSAPRQFQPHTSASSSAASVDQIDFQKAREASALRMLDVWSNLADRYSRPLDEDDIIDLNTGKVVKDRGVIRRSRHWDLGCFADDVGDEAEEGDEEEDEDDIDELDSFAPQQSIGGQPLIVEEVTRNVPPVREMDPADAEDLKQFLEAERRRRETCGSEVEETESSVTESHDEGYLEDKILQHSFPAQNTDDSIRERNATSDIPSKSCNTTTPNLEVGRTPMQRSASMFVDSGSDDELVSYDIDEASVVYRIPKKEEARDSDSEVEFVEPPLLPLRPKPKPKSIKQQLEHKSSQLLGHTYPKPPQQLQTPPLSQTSSLISSVTPSDDYYIELPPDSSSPLPPSSPPSSHYSSPIKTPQHAQNKNSFGSRRLPSPPEREMSLKPIPRLDLTKLSKRKPILKSKISKSKLPPSRSQPRPEASGSGSSSMAESGGLVNQEPLARPRMEVVINKRVPFQHKPQSRPTPAQRIETTTAESLPDRMRSFENIRTTGKGKEKAKQLKLDSRFGDPGALELTQSDDSIIILSSSPSPASSRNVIALSPRASESDIKPPVIVSRGRRQSRERPTRGKSPNSDKPKHTSTITTKKRKRSFSSEVEITGLSGTPSLPPDRQTRSEVLRRVQPPSPPSPDALSSTENEPADMKDPGPLPRSKRKPIPKQRSRSSSRPRKSEYDSDSSSRSSPERFLEQRYRYNRAHSHFGSIPPSDLVHYPYPPALYPPQIFAPIPDPRAQYIITQAMHQLSALVGGSWAPPGSHHRNSTPFTPSHNRHQSRALGSTYSTPTHQHPYPYSYDASLSKGTLPPDSPEAQSSSPVSNTFARRKSLVKRSRSKGRRVSFRIEQEIIDTNDIPSNHAGRDEDDYLEISPDRNNEGLEDDAQPSRGRSFTRAQTPGPPVRDPPLEPHSGKPSTNSPTNLRGTSRSRPSQTR